MLRLSVLDLAPFIQGSEAAAALKHAKGRAALDQISPDRVGELRDFVDDNLYTRLRFATC
jgi:hypothetical protein